MPDLQFITVTNPVAGLILNAPSTIIPNEASPAMSNMRIIDNYMEKGKGAAASQGTAATPLNGIVMRLDQYSKDAGTDHLMWLTTSKTY